MRDGRAGQMHQLCNLVHIQPSMLGKQQNDFLSRRVTQGMEQTFACAKGLGHVIKGPSFLGQDELSVDWLNLINGSYHNQHRGFGVCLYLLESEWNQKVPMIIGVSRFRRFKRVKTWMRLLPKPP